MIKFADKKIAEQIIKELYPNAKEIVFIDEGYDNLVGIVDKTYALRFPRHMEAYARNKFEQIVLKGLQGITDFIIPKVLDQNDDPPYVITNFIPGKHISADEINSLSKEEQKIIAEQIAEFAFQMHSLLSPSIILEYRERYNLDGEDGLDEPWESYIENTLDIKFFPTFQQDTIAKEYYKRWKNIAYNTDDVVIHDDLHTDNLMFNQTKLVGVIDFGDTNIGHPEQELRQTYRINEFVMHFAVTKYEQLSGQSLNREAIKLWAIVQELAAYSDKLLKKEFEHPVFIRTIKNLNKWIPEGKWDVL